MYAYYIDEFFRMKFIEKILIVGARYTAQKIRSFDEKQKGARDFPIGQTFTTTRVKKRSKTFS